MTSCRLVKIYRCFEGLQSLHFQGQALREEAAFCWNCASCIRLWRSQNLSKRLYIFINRNGLTFLKTKQSTVWCTLRKTSNLWKRQDLSLSGFEIAVQRDTERRLEGYRKSSLAFHCGHHLFCCFERCCSVRSFQIHSCDLQMHFR